MATYAVGDLHGEVSLLQRLLAQTSPVTGDRLIFLGDYLDRGEDSIATVACLLRLRATPGLQVICLRGNHDADWWEAWDAQLQRFRSYPLFLPGARELWERCDGNMPSLLATFLAETQVAYEDEHGFYAHAGALPGSPFWESPPEWFVYGGQGLLSSRYEWGGKPVVFGHYEFEAPQITTNKIGLDTAAYRSGVLTALRLDDRSIIQVSR